ncbi:MAG: M48 family metallopeptidase [Opitutales bacterium]|nr:M48 family metallopeptidase [Opitutales bacterium]
MNTLLWIVVGLLIARMGMQLYLEWANSRAVLAASGSVPVPFRSFIDEATYAKSIEYTLAKGRLTRVEVVWDAAILAVVLLSGLLPWLWTAFAGIWGTGVWADALSLFVIGWLLSLPGLPFDWYGTFRLEERFGFNRSTVGLWISDKVKGLFLGVLLGIPLIALILWLVGMSEVWWLWAFAAIFVFQIIMMVLFPMIIMPLFNKFEELPEGELKRRLFALADRTGFRAKTILQMDGSKRSAHSNAFFTGFGRFRRIVLFDTLIGQMDEPELEAVLAHEIGHYKCGHIPRMLGLAAVSLFVSFAVIGWLAASPWFVEAFGFAWEADRLGPALLLFMLLSGLVTFWISPLSNRLSRKHEYEADAFARDAMAGDPQPLVSALRKLSAKNLSNLTPAPVYSGFYYSHPTLLEREGAVSAGPP